MNKVGEKVNLPDSHIFPAPPPDNVFQNRGFRKDPYASVAQDYVTYVYDADRPGGAVVYDENEGIFTYYKGVPLPRAGLPFAQAVYAINGTKRLIIHAVKILNVIVKELNIRLIGLVFTSKKKRARILEQILQSFQSIAIVSLHQYYMKEGYYCKTAKEVWKFVRAFLLSLGISYETADKTGEIFAMVFEYDDAYRYPFQDVMGETTIEKLIKEFPKEIGRLLEIEASRDNSGSDPNTYNRHFKFLHFVKLLKVVWWVPSFRSAIKAGFAAVNHENWKLTEGDIFHTMLWADYNIKGIPTADRIKQYYEIFGNDESKMPPRIQIKLG